MRVDTLNTMEWCRLRDYAKQRTIAEFRNNGLAGLYAIAKRTDENKKNFVSEVIARECEKWCKPPGA